MSIRTVDTHWDCECQHNYIHPKSESVCAVCGAEADDMPDSHENEVLIYQGKCPECNGTGNASIEKDTAYIPCMFCGGDGKFSNTKQD